MAEELFFLISGAVAGFGLLTLLRWLVGQSKKPEHEWVVARLRNWRVLLLLAALVVTGLFFFDIGNTARIILVGHLADPWESDAIDRSRLLSRQYITIIVGIICGAVLFFFYEKSLFGDEKEDVKDFRKSIGRIVVVSVLLILFAPFVERIVTNSTSLEVGQIGKITFAVPQGAATQSTRFTAGPGGSGTSQYKANDVRYPLEALASLSRVPDGGNALATTFSGSDEKTKCLGVAQRDRAYIDLIDNNFKTERSSINKPVEFASPIPGKDSKLNTAIDYDIEFFESIKYLPLCLQQYAQKFADYRLLLIDIKPLIQSFTIMTSYHGDKAEQGDEVEDFCRDQPGKDQSSKDQSGKDQGDRCSAVVGQIHAATLSARDQLAWLGTKTGNNYCSKAATALESAGVKHVLTGNRSPYRTLALAYLLSAVGGADKASVELNAWLKKNQKRPRDEVHPWYLVRVQIEISLMLQSFLDQRERDPIYRKFMEALVSDFAKILPASELSLWSKSCRPNNIFENNIVASYVAALNEYIRASTSLETISQAVLKTAKDLRNVDMTCFGKVPGFQGQEDAWTANILTTYASALVAASFSDRLYGQDSSRQKKIRAEARRDLKEALVLFARQESKSALADEAVGASCGQLDDDRQPAGSDLLAQGAWAGVRSTARDLILRVPDEAE